MQSSEPTGATWCERLFSESAAQLILYGRAMGLSHSEAEDVLQDTFLSLLRLDRPPENPSHYAVRSFRNRALNFRRSLWRRLAREWESRHWFEQEPAESGRERALMQRLAALPAAQREVIVLKLWHGLTFDEIAQLTGVSANTVAGRYRYGLQKLKAALGEAHDEQPESAGGAPAWLAAPSAIHEA